MLSPVWQRIGIIIGVLLGSLCWLGVLPSLQASAGTGGLVLLNCSSVVTAIVLVIIAGLPAVLLGTLLSTVGWFTAGVSVFAGTLIVLTWYGGSVSGWFQRATLPGDYWHLILETVIWQVLVLAAILLMSHFRPIVHRQLPQLLQRQIAWKTALGIPASQEISAALISALVAGLMAMVLIQNAAPKQVLVSLVVSFALGAGLGQTMMPNTNPIAIFVSPGVVAICSYLMVIFRYGDQAAVLQAMYAGSEPGTGIMSQFPGAAMALPIDYLSAGLLGCCLGIGLVRGAVDQQDMEKLAQQIV